LEGASTSAFRDVKNVSELEFQANCEPSTFTKFASTVLLKFQTREDLFSEERLSRLEELFLESYNAANSLKADRCDPHFRQVMTAIAIPDLIEEANLPLYQFDNSYVYVMLQISGKCIDCDSNIKLFDKGSSSLVCKEVQA
jgi:hypothetical protein